MLGTMKCIYEIPRHWCSKWDKKCDCKIGCKDPIKSVEASPLPVKNEKSVKKENNNANTKI